MGNRSSRENSTHDKELQKRSTTTDLNSSLVVKNKYSDASINDTLEMFTDEEDDVFETSQEITIGHNSGVHCLLPPTPIPLSSTGGQYEASGLSINIPSGAIDPGEELTLTVAAVIATVQCTYPNGVKQISPVFMIHPSKEVHLKKSIKLTIPHFLHGHNEINCHIGVLKADYNSKAEPLHYNFKKLSDCGVTLGVSEDGEGIATFQIQHFCFFQLYSDSSLKEKALKAAYCICRFEPKEEKFPRFYYYVLTYKMKVFIKAVEEQFPCHKRGRVLEFLFKNPDDKRIIVTNHFEKENWNITFEGSQTDKDECLLASSLERWGNDEQDIEFDIECELYPPKFKLQICPKRPGSAGGSVEICVPFKGVTKVSDTKESVVDHFMVVFSGSRSKADQQCGQNITNDSEIRLQAIKASCGKICSLVQHDIANFADILLQYKLIPVELQTSTLQTDGITDITKARRLINAVCSQVEVDPAKYEVFLNALRDAGDFLGSIVNELEHAIPSISPRSSVAQLSSICEDSGTEETDSPIVEDSGTEDTDSPNVNRQPMGVNVYSLLSYISGKSTTV